MPVPATPLLDAALRRAKAGDTPVAAERPIPASIVPQDTVESRSTTPVEPAIVPGSLVLTDALPLLASTSEKPKIDPKVAAAAALVPGRAVPPAAGAGPIDPDRSTGSAEPSDVWREGLDRLRSVARDRAAEKGKRSHELWMLRAQILDGLDEPASTEAPAAEVLRRTVLNALVGQAAPGSGPTDAPVWAAQIRSAIEALEDRTPLEITELQLCRKVKGFGDYEPLEAAAYRPGHGVILYCEMAGVRYEPEGDFYRSRLASRVEIVASGGSEPIWKHVPAPADDLCRRRRRDFYVNYRITLPESLVPGSYDLRLIQDDLVASRTSTRAVALVIAP